MACSTQHDCFYRHQSWRINWAGTPCDLFIQTLNGQWMMESMGTTWTCFLNKIVYELEVIFGFLCFQNVPNFPEELANKIARIGRLKEKSITMILGEQWCSWFLFLCLFCFVFWVFFSTYVLTKKLLGKNMLYRVLPI